MKKIWTLATIALVFSLDAAAWGEKGTPLTEWFGQQPNATDGAKASWANSTLWTGSATLRKLSIVTQVKGAGDDTIRLFTNQSAAPRHTFLLSDTSTSSGTAMANRWRKDLIDSTGAGFTAAAAYDINADGYTDMFAGRTASPYRLKRYYWTGTGWNTDTTAATLPGAINDMAVGDADNDGSVDDIIATSSNAVYHVHWNGAGFDTTRIWAGDASTCYGVAIGDFDADHTGNEVVAVTYGQRVMRLVWSGASWDTTTLFLSPNDLDFYEVAIGDFDASSPGAEIAVGNGYLQATYGSVLEVYGSGSSWNVRALYTSAESVRELAIGDFLDENPGDEIVIAPYTSPYNVRAIYGSGTTWAQQLMFTTGGTSYGAAVGNVDQYRSYNDEVAITGNSRVFEAAQYWPANDLAITSGGPLSYPFVTDEPESIWVRVKNNGTNNQPSFDLNLYINGASYSSVSGLSLNSGDSLDVVLPFVVSGANTAVNFTIYHSLSPDETPANDTLGTMDPVAGLTRRFHDWIFPANTYKAEGFEYMTAFPPAGWVRINNDGGSYNWGWYTSSTNPRQIHSGRLYTANRWESSSLRNDDWLVTDAISIPDGYTDTLSFFWREMSLTYGPESLEVWAMSGQTVNDTIPGGLLWAGQISDTLYQLTKVDLGRFAGQNINIGFRHRSLDVYYIMVDDISFARYDAPPTITYTSPADGATGVLVNAPLVIAFSEPIDASTYSGFFTPDPAGWDSSWNATMDTITWTHNDYATSTLHTYQVLTANDLNGNPLAAGPVPNPFTFTTNADGTPPTASLVSPAWGATDVALNEPIVIAFSEPMNTGSVDGDIVPDIDMTPSWNTTGDTLTLTPNYPYAYSTLYTAIITQGQDLAGYNLVALPDTIAQFTTIANQGPNIEMVLQPGDTYDGTGPFTVRAVITDPAKAGVDTAVLYYSVNQSNWNDLAGAPAGGDTFNFSISGPWSSGSLVSYYLMAVDDAGDTIYSPANAPIGVYQFRILSPLPPSNLTANAGDMFVQLDWAPPAQNLNYAATPFYIFNVPAGFIGSVRYTPMHYPCKLEQLTSMWFNSGGMDSVVVHIYADDGTGMPDVANQLVTPFAIMPQAYSTATVVDVSAYNIVLTSGEFHVGYELRTDGAPRYMSDNGSYGAIRSLYYWPGDTWYGDLGYDWIQSAVVSYSPYTKGLALKSSHLPRGRKPNYRMDGKALKAEELTDKREPVYGKLTGALWMAKNIAGTEILRGDAPGGPYTTSLGTTTNVSLIDASVSNGSTYYYVARAVYSAPDTFSAFSNEDTASPAGMPILLVDDDRSNAGAGWPDRAPIYTAAVDGAGYTGQYTVYEVDGTAGADGPPASWFTGRTHVVWWSGGNWEEQNTLTPTDEANLAAYLNGGGKLFYCAQDYLYDRYISAGSFSPGQFPYDYLGLASVNQDVIDFSPYNIAGVTGSLAEGLAYGVIEDPNVGTFADDLTKRSVAGTYDVLDVTAKVGEKTGVAYDNGTFRTVFFTTLFEDITDGTNTKAELMYRILNWLSTGVEGEPAASAKPTVISLSNNYPNPVRTSTTIKFGLPKDSDVRIEVFNIAGQKVKTLASGKLNAGYHTVTWKGANDNGQKVAAGVYLVRMVTPEFTGTRKMTVLR
jgi:hypothetical protein